MKKSRLTSMAVIGVAIIGAAGYGLYALGMHQGMSMASRGSVQADNAASPAPSAGQSVAQGEEATRRHITAGLKAGDVDPLTGKKILYYHDPMVPANKFDKPAKSPFMDMMLVPVYADGDADSSTVTVSPRLQQSLGVRTAVVSEGSISTQLSAVGAVAFNERDQVIVQSRAAGYVERLHVRATLDTVSRGQPLAELYVPDWIAAQEEFLSVRRMQGTDMTTLVDAARQRMRQVGMSDAQVARIEASGQVQPRITVNAPIGGVLTELAIREGMTITPGTTLFKINGLTTVWANAEVPESQAALVRPGAKVQARSPAVPGYTFEGKVQALVPNVNPATRTIKARLELANKEGRLVPGMFVQMQFMNTRPEKVVLVPTEAVIQTGTRTVAMLVVEEGGTRFRPVEIELGIETDGQTEVKRGLKVGQRVVVSSQFLIDSEASLKGIESRLNGDPKPPGANAAPRYQAEGKVESVDPDAVTLSHGPIPALKWGPMTMEFKPPAGGTPRGVGPGATVVFEFYMDADNQAQLTAITPAVPEAKPKDSKDDVPGSRR